MEQALETGPRQHGTAGTEAPASCGCGAGDEGKTGNPESGCGTGKRGAGKGEITQEQYDGLQREIIETEERLKSLEEQANQSAVAVQKIAAVGRI